MALLQAYIDDSACESGSQRLFLAGYLNTTSDWDRFVTAWGEELRTVPTISYLKMVEAAQLRGQFRDWTATQRDEKLRGFVRLARHFKPVSFSVSIDRASYRSLVQPHAPRGLGNAYFVACFAAVTIVSKYAASKAINTPVEFVFDEQLGVDDDFRLFFGHMTDHLPRSARRLIAGPPVFADDKHRLPLQLSDLLAWHVRRSFEDPANLKVRLLADALRSPEHVTGHVDEDRIARLGAGFTEIPGAKALRSKAQWRGIKQAIEGLTASGYKPPYGVWWKNLLFRWGFFR